MPERSASVTTVVPPGGFIAGPATALPPLQYRVFLDELTAELATFTWTARGEERAPAVLAIPRGDWEHLGRPGALDVPIHPRPLETP
jgi:hypothetical protein